MQLTVLLCAVAKLYRVELACLVNKYLRVINLLFPFLTFH